MVHVQTGLLPRVRYIWEYTQSPQVIEVLDSPTSIALCI